MKRFLAVSIIVIFLTGCAYGTSTVSPIFSAQVISTPTAEIAPQTLVTRNHASPTTVAATTETAAKTPTTEPSHIPTYLASENPTIPVSLLGHPKPELDVGCVSISNKDCIYYAKFVEEYGTAIYRIERKTGLEEKIRDLEERAGITGIFLDANGTLYYSCKNGLALEGEYYYASHLYRYSPQGDTLIAKDLGAILRVDQDAIYYTTENFNTMKSAIYRYDISDQSIHLIRSFDGGFRMLAALNEYPAVIYSMWSRGNEGTAFDSLYYCTNLESGSTQPVFQFEGELRVFGIYILLEDQITDTKVECRVLDVEHGSVQTLILPCYARHVAIMDHRFNFSDSDGTELYQYDLKTGKRVASIKTGPIKDSFFDGRYLYLLTFQTDDDYHSSDIKITRLDCRTNKQKVVLRLDERKLNGDDRYTYFTIDAGFLWLFNSVGCEEANFELLNKYVLK